MNKLQNNFNFLLIIKNYIIFVKYKILYKKYNQKQQENNFITSKLIK